MTTRWPFVLLASSAFALSAEATSFSRGVCGSGSFFGLEAVGLTDDQRLVCFKADAPKFLRTIGSVSGLSGDAKLIGIDYRPKNGVLYGIGDAGGVYTIDPSNAAASFLFTVVLDGASFGVDFNPAADRLRIVSDTGQNLRINVDDGTVTPDGALTYSPTVVPPPVATGISGAAYTNNDASLDTATTLFDIDTTLDQVAIQAPPNNGALNPTGKLRVDAGRNVGFDIYSFVRGDRTSFNVAYASLTTGGPRVGMYSVDLLTGEATLRGAFDATQRVIDIALPLNQRSR